VVLRAQLFCPITEFISHKTTPKQWGETAISAAVSALEIPRRPEHQNALGAPSEKMSEMPGVAGQQILGVPVNRR
jgi:hypothetical protein